MVNSDPPKGLKNLHTQKRASVGYASNRRGSLLDLLSRLMPQLRTNSYRDVLTGHYQRVDGLYTAAVQRKSLEKPAFSLYSCKMSGNYMT